MIEPASDDWVVDVYDYWFDELTPQQWFAASREVDEAVRSRFSTLHRERVALGVAIGSDPRSAVAHVIVLDQFSRNLYRGKAEAYAADPLALASAEAAIAAGFDASLSVHERLFLYLPFEHSEDLAQQRRSVDLIASLGDGALLRYATEHKDIVERFGRFPHRNAMLGRTSTAEEIDFMRSAAAPEWMKAPPPAA